jgi:predicted kinase
VNSVERLDQRALACPVLSQQGVNFPAVNMEADSVVGDERPETLSDPIYPQDGVCGMHRTPTVGSY